MKKLALVYPGQGSQYVGMCKEFYNEFAVVKETFNEASEALGIDMANLCFQENIEELTKTYNAQPAILTASIAMNRVFFEKVGIKPQFVAGHSLGEYSALVSAGAISFWDAVKIVHKRGQLMQEAVAFGEGSMVSIFNVDLKIIELECLKASYDNEIAVVSNLNSNNQIVISGHTKAVERVCKNIEKYGEKIVKLNVSAPFHSPLMKPASDNLKEVLEKYNFHDIKFPVLSNVNGVPYESKDKIVDNLIEQLVKPVNWIGIMNYFQKMGIDMVVEIGPKSILKGFIDKSKYIMDVLAIDNMKEKDEIFKIDKELYAFDKDAKLRFMTRCLAIAVCTRNQNWDNEEYNKGFVEKYKYIQELVDNLELQDEEPTIGQMRESIEMLQGNFKTKKTPVDEQIQRFNQLFYETGMRELFQDFKICSE